MRALIPSRRLATLVLFGLCALWSARTAAAQSQTTCRDTPEGRVCTGQQPLVLGALVSQEDQRDLGLVTVGGGCSGTLLNRFWVLTADHCVTTNGALNGPSLDPASLMITATWSTETVRASRLVRNWGGGGLDVALVFLGAGDFGPANIQLLSLNEVEEGNRLVKYGRGISRFAVEATATTPAQPALNDGFFRSATFTASANATATSYILPLNAANQVGAGGDSGCPDVLLAPNGVGLGIAGVQSGCSGVFVVAGRPLNLPGGGLNWMWVTKVANCNSAPIAGIRFDLLQIIQEEPANLTPLYYYLLSGV
jgi:hypothetical protein